MSSAAMKTRLVSFLLVFAAFFSASPVVAGQGGGGKLDRALQQVATTGGPPQRVIVRFTEGEQARVKDLVAARGPVRAEHPGVNAITAVLSAADLTALAADPGVAALTAEP